MSNFLDKCVTSVLNQTYEDFTLILINDGSTDDSLNRCIRWSRMDDRIIVVSEANIGLGPTRNLGVKMCSSEYVTFLDADDWWRHDYLELMMQGVESGKNDVVLCDINYVMESSAGGYECNSSSIRLPSGSLKISDEWNLINRARTFMWGKIYRKNLFSDYQIEQPSHTYEDVATTPYLIARAKSIYHVPQGLYYYLRNRQGSIVNDFSSLKGLLCSLEDLYERFQESGLLMQFYSSLRQLFWGQFVFIYRSLKARFPNEINDEKERIRCEAARIVCKCFPELEGMRRYSFGVPRYEPVLIEALKKIVVNEEAILQGENWKDADYIVTTREEVFHGKSLLINMPSENIEDEERIAWDIADEIFYEMFS